MVPGVEVVNVRDGAYGALGDGRADDTFALQRAVHAACKLDGVYGPAGGTLYLPAGVYRTTRPLEVWGVHGLQVVGQGLASRVEYDGPPEQPAFDLRAVEKCTFRRFWVFGRRGAAAAFRVSNRGPNDPKTPWSNSGCRWDEVYVGIDTTGLLKYGWDVDSTAHGGPDRNNDLHSWARCRAIGYTDAAWRVNGTQVHALAFEGCEMLGTRGGRFGVLMDSTAYLSWRGGSGGYHRESDFFFRAFGARNVIAEWNSENSKRLFDSGTPTCAPTPLAIRDCRWEGVAADDGAVVRVHGPGPISVRNCLFGSARPDAPIPRIHVSSAPACPGTLEVIGNLFRSGRPYGAGPVVAPAQWEVLERGNRTV